MEDAKEGKEGRKEGRKEEGSGRLTPEQQQQPLLLRSRFPKALCEEKRQTTDPIHRLKDFLLGVCLPSFHSAIHSNSTRAAIVK